MNKANINCQDKDECTPLCLAIRGEKDDAAMFLIDAGAKVTLGGPKIGYPIHLAVSVLKIELVRRLIEQGADLNCLDSDGNSPLHILMSRFSVCSDVSRKILDILVLKGSNVNLKNNHHWAPLHTAVR